MDATKAVIDALEDLISADSASCRDDFQVLEIRIGRLGEARPVLQRLLARVSEHILRYETAVVQLARHDGSGWGIRHPVTRDEADVLLVQEVLDEGLLCDEHAETYRAYLHDQEEELALQPWQRYGLLESVGACQACSVKAWAAITLDKVDLESRLKEGLGHDLPHVAGRLDGVRLLYWCDFDDFTGRVAESPLEMHQSLARWAAPCLMLSSRSAANGGSAYLHSISTARATERATMEATLHRLLDAPALDPLVRSRRTEIEEVPEAVGYLPPEYWVSADVLARTRGGEELPAWFVSLAPLFVYAMLATVSSRVSTGAAGEQRVAFEIEREFALRLDCRLRGSDVTIDREDGEERVGLDQDVLRGLLGLYMVALQGKYTAVNRDLVQRSIVYGTRFTFDAFFDRLVQIGQFYAFEYKDLLGDRFEQQSKTLSTFISDMVNLRQRLASLVESLSKDLSGLTTAVLATAALSIVARTMNLETWDSLVIYGLATAPVLAYLYLPVFFLRIDNLRDLGERAVDAFLRDMALSEEIWDFPLHEVGIEEEDLDRRALLKPLRQQHRMNETAAIACGAAVHALLLALTAYQGAWWLLGPKVAADSAFLGWGIWRRRYGRRFWYHVGVHLVTLALVVAYGLSGR